jgi:carnitine 3-dehydrogenase
VLEHLGPPLESWWHDMGRVALSTELNKRLADGVDDELAGTDLAVLTRQRDALLLGLLEQKAAIDAGRPT